MKAQILKALRRLGVDRAIAYTVLGRGWSVLSGPLTLFFVAAYLTRAEQGFYYTFGSVLGLQTFFELGLGFVLLQFAGHEKSRLEWTPQGTLQGDPVSKERLASLLRMALRWYGVVAILVLVVVLPVGVVFFGRNAGAQASQAVIDGAAQGVIWQSPWVWVVLVAVVDLLISPLFAVLEGCGLVADIALMRLAQNVLTSGLLWVTLASGGRLFAAPLCASASVLWALGWLWLRQKRLVRDLLATPRGTGRLDWWREVWPLQWRIAGSWLSGFLVFQLFNPVLFAFHGPVAAGQMGMSISVMGAVSTTSIAWMTTKAAPFTTLVARRQFRQLDATFFPCLWQSLALATTGGVMLWAGDFWLHAAGNSFSRRLLPPLPMGLMIAASLLYHIIGAQAIYLRAHKQEPFLVMSLLSAVLMSISSFFLGRTWGATGMMAGYLAITATVGLGLSTSIFMSKRRLWHSDHNTGPQNGTDIESDAPAAGAEQLAARG